MNKAFVGTVYAAMCWAIGISNAARAQTTELLPDAAAADAQTPGNDAVPDRVPISAPPSADVAEGGRITIKVNNVTLDQAVQLFMDTVGANIITPSTNLPGRVSVNLKDVEWRAALKNILETHGHTLIEKGADTPSPVYIVAPRPPDAPEPLFIENFVLRYKRPEALIDGVKALVAPNGQVLHSGGNMLTILATADALRNARKLVEEVDLRIPQVLIEAKFVELNDQAIKDLGINWQSLEAFQLRLGGLQWDLKDQSGVEQTNTRTSKDFRESERSATRFFDVKGKPYEEKQTTYEEVPPGSGNVITATKITPTQSNTEREGRNEAMDRSRVDSRTYASVKTALLSADEFQFTLSALQQSGGADVISNPKIVVASGERATILVGRKDPEIKAVADNNLQGRLTYQREGWIESGVRLDVQPIVNTADSISVSITPQLSRVVGYAESGDTRVKIPILSTREINSQFSLPSGRTVAIGGLTETQDREVVKKIPLLGDLPLIGRYLFSHTHTERIQDEIIIFVTLAVAESDDMHALSGVPADGRLIRERIAPAGDGSNVQLRPRESK